MGGETYHLFARGYLGYGLSQARQRYLEIITWQSITKGVIESPCHHKGFQEQMTVRGKVLMMIGTASVDICRSIIEKTFFSKLLIAHFMTSLAYMGISLVLRGYFMPPMAQGCSVAIA